VSQITIGRFHHFHLARQLEKRGLLKAVFTGYPKFKLKNEQGIPSSKIQSFPWIHVPYMARYRFRSRTGWLPQEMVWWARKSLDRYAAANLGDANVVIALPAAGSSRKAEFLFAIAAPPISAFRTRFYARSMRVGACDSRAWIHG
jgi:hypothetical protein